MRRAGDGRGQAVSRPDEYLELIQEFPLRPIRAEAELDAAIQRLDALSDRAQLSADAKDYLIVLAGLVEAYEREAYPIPSASGAEILEHLIEAKGVTQREVSAGAGIAEPTISELLRGKRELNRRHIEALARYFGVSPAAFFPG